MEQLDAREELAALVAAFRTGLAWRLARGQTVAPAGVSPRLMTGGGPASEAAGCAPPAEEVAARASTAAQAECDLEAAVGVTRAPAGGADEPPLARLQAALADCSRCDLAAVRSQVVFGAGCSPADLMFVGGAPGEEEDERGAPFVGAAGQLLTRMIEAMGLTRENVYIANVIKCRPPGDRSPSADEVASCRPALERQIEIVRPKLIVALGAVAAQTLLASEAGITALRGRFHSFRGIPLMPTFHPAYLLLNPTQKRATWHDLQQVMAEMDRRGLKRRPARQPHTSSSP